MDEFDKARLDQAIATIRPRLESYVTDLEAQIALVEGFRARLREDGKAASVTLALLRRARRRTLETIGGLPE